MPERLRSEESALKVGNPILKKKIEAGLMGLKGNS